MIYSTALSLTLPSLTSDHRQHLLETQPLLSLYEVFTTLPDPRSKHGLRYELAYLLTCLVAGILCNCDSTLAIAQWCRDQRPLLTRLFGPRRFLCPSDSLYRKLLARLDVEAIEWTLADWIRSTLCAQPDDPIALDGKTVRGARKDDQPAPHLLSFRTHHSQETLLQVVVCEKTNEIPVAQALLPCLPIDGRIVTADALHTQKDFMQCVDALGGKTVLTVKNNQPTLYSDLATYFADPHASFEQSSTRDQHRGRIETRSIRVSSEMNSYLTDWPLIQQVAELTRTVTVRKTGKTSHEVVYLITPLTALEAGPHRLLELVRGQVDELLEADGVVHGVRYRGVDGWHEIHAILTVGADGRFSRLRRLSGFEAIKTAPMLDILWFRLSHKDTDKIDSLGGRLGAGMIAAVIDRFDYWQIGYVIPKGQYQVVRAAGLPELQRRLAKLVPQLADRVDELQDWKQVSVLSVESDRLPRWYRPGLLLIGDAAHVMSPVGGVGINYAIQDAVVAANILADKLKYGVVQTSDLARVQRERELPTRILQAFQAVIQKQVLAQAMNTSGQFELSPVLRFLLRLPLLRDIPGRMIAFGPFPAHVRKA